MRVCDLPATQFEQAYRAWRAGTGPWLPYARATPFVSLADGELQWELPDPATLDLAFPAMPELADSEVLVLDLPAAACLKAGLWLLAQAGRWPVVTFAHWFHPHGRVGDAASAALLLLQAPAAAQDLRGWTLLLDAGRYADAPLTPDCFNNQYELTEQDLPTVEELQAAGLSGVVLVSLEPVKEDLARYARYLAAFGIGVRWHA